MNPFHRHHWEARGVNPIELVTYWRGTMQELNVHAATEVLEVCGCCKRRIRTLDGNWTLAQLTGSSPVQAEEL